MQIIYILLICLNGIEIQFFSFETQEDESDDWKTVTIPIGCREIDKTGEIVGLDLFGVEEAEVIAEIKNAPKLVEVNLEYAIYTPKIVNCLANCKSLRSIYLGKFEDSGRNELTNESLVQLKKCHELETLTIRGQKIDDEGVKELRKLPKLSNLNLVHCSISFESHKIFAKMPKLKKLKLRTDRFTKSKFDLFCSKLPNVTVSTVTIYSDR